MLVALLGPPRSGTTLLAHLISLHPEAMIYNESHLWLDVPWMFACNEGDHQKASIGQDSIYYWSLHRIKLFHGKDPNVLSRGVIDGLMRAEGSPKVYGDKSPLYCLFWKEIMSAFPDIRFVYIERDFEATARSLLRMTWFHGKNIEAARNHIQMYLDGIKGCPLYLSTSLEALESDPEPEIGRILERLGLEPMVYPWATAMERFEPGARIN